MLHIKMEWKWPRGRLRTNLEKTEMRGESGEKIQENRKWRFFVIVDPYLWVKLKKEEVINELNISKYSFNLIYWNFSTMLENTYITDIINVQSKDKTLMKQ